MKSKAASSSSSLSSSSAVGASLADLHHHHHQHQHHSSLGGLFGSAGGQGSAASLLASHPHHLGSYGSGSNNSAAQQIFNYAAAQLNSSSSNNKNSAHQEGGGNWSTENAMALQMSQLFGSNSAAAAAAANPETFAQLNAASQLIAASLIQQRQQQQQDSHNNEPTPPRKSSSKNQNQNNSNFNSNNNTSNHSNSNANSSLLTCSICGQVSRDPSDYEQHLMTHISLLSANQNAYQYGLNFLRMQNLFNGSSGGGNAATNGTSGAIPGSTVPNGTGSSTIMNKKRKLLAKHQADSMDLDQETMKMKMSNHHHRSAESEFDSLSRLGLENLLKGTASLDGSGASESHLMVAQQAQSILAQFAQQANKGNGPLGSPTLNATSTSTNSNTAITNSITSGNCTGSNSTNTSVSTAYPCTNCHKTFATEVDLKAHLIRHLTQHPFVCVSCGKGFKYEHSLNFHIKSYHSGNATGSNGTDGSTNGGKKGGSGKASDSESGPPLKLKKNRNSAAAREAAALEFDELDELPEPKNCGTNSLKLGSPNPSLTIPTSGASSSLLHSRLTLMDENHNAMATATAASGSSALSLLCSPGGSSVGASGGTGSNGKFNSELPFFFGKPPTNLPPDSPIQIRSEKLLISILDAVNVATDQSLIFYKCCLCCVAFASLDQMSIHIQNVHLPPGAAASCGAAELFTNSGAQLFGNAKEVLGSGGSSGNQQFSCDKCTAKFTASPEYEMHMQLHRTLEAQAMAAPGSGQTSAAALQQQYPFNLLSHLHPGVNIPGANYPGASTNPTNSANQATVDFRQILANASKDTDFGRKFAAQLLQESTKDHLASLDPFHHHHGAVQQHLHHRNSAKSLFHDSFDRCSPPSTPANAHSKLSPGSGGTGSSDPNNNSLLYLSLLPEHAKSQTTSESTSNRNSRFKVDSTTTSSILNLSHESKVTPSSTPEKVARKPRNTNASSDSSGKSSGSNSSNNGSALRHIKEPVDIFEGAGQSLPIQKFPIGDIEETAPGQFKCRFCDKTFDRVFSVHRHERVHTGFKPCICKTCGRGFSEKRNLRHHIIRFHSDGSGRELLKRKRKPKTGGMFNGNHSELSGESMLLRNESIMSSLLTGNGVPSSGGSGSRRGSRNGNSSVPESLFNAFRQSSAAQAVAQASALNGGGGSLSNLKLSLAEMDQLKGHFGGRDDGLLGSAMNLSNGSNNRPTSGSSSSSRRRKSKPSRKVYDEEEEDDDDEDEDHNEHHHHLNQKKEMLVVDVDVVPLVTEEDEDEDEDEDELDDDEDEEVDDVDEDDDEEEVMVKQEADHHLQDKYRKDIKQQNHSDSDDGDETEEETINGDAPDDKSPLNGTFKSEDLSELPETVQNLNSTNADHNESKDQRSNIKSEPESEFDESESNDAIPSTKKMPKKVNNNNRKLSLKRKSK